MLTAPADYINQLAFQFCRYAGFAEDCTLPWVAKVGCLAAGLVSAAGCTSSVHHTSSASSMLLAVELGLH
jgi:hypothetical protein